MSELPDYDIWKLTESPYLRNEPSLIGVCCVCYCEIYENEDHYKMENDDIVCEDCDFEYMRQFKKVGA